MPKSSRVLSLVLLAAAGILMAGFNNCGPSSPTLNPLTLLPTDACASSTCVPPVPPGLPAGFTDSCSVSSTTFATWFQTPGTPIPAPVNTTFAPANSVSFSNLANCAFYQWAMQDFLWLTSPTTSLYGGTGLILDSPAFYDVSPPGAGGNRTFLPHTLGFIHPLALRAAQADAQGLQMIFDASGTPIQVKPAPAGTAPVVLNNAGQRVQIARVQLGKGGKLTLLDASGNVIQAQHSVGAKPVVRDEKGRAEVPTMITAQKFVIDGIPIFIGPSQTVIDVEQGEADDGVVQAQLTSGGSLIYYAILVNDVYAYYATEVLDGKISLPGDGICTPSPAPCFPTTGPQLAQIVSAAAGHFPPGQTTFPDANALAIEVKSAWVAAAGLPNLSSYITMNATIPIYSPTVPPPSGTTTLTDTGKTQTVQLALVGMHVVGSAAGHPEMIWATFEHVANAPRDTYSYVNSSGATATVNLNVATLPTIGGAGAPWLFSATNVPNPCNVNQIDTLFNSQYMTYNASPTPATIVALSTPGNCAAQPTVDAITPANIMRWKPFGAATDVNPNPVDPSIAVSNTEIIAVNNSINNSTAPLLATGDVRLNYVMTGATWTAGGVAPTGNPPGFPVGGNQVGTSSLGNTTMETYEQGSSSSPQTQGSGTNCFSCHNGQPPAASGPNSNTTNVSHIFPFVNKGLF
jgi:hypothetical protein